MGATANLLIGIGGGYMELEMNLQSEDRRGLLYHGYAPPPTQPPMPQQPNWPAQWRSDQFATRTDQRVHQIAWAVFFLIIAHICSVLAVITAFTIVGAIVFGLAGVGFWTTAFVFSIMALSRR